MHLLSVLEIGIILDGDSALLAPNIFPVAQK